MRVVIAEDNTLLREGIARLPAEAGLTVVSGVLVLFTSSARIPRPRTSSPTAGAGCSVP